MARKRTARVRCLAVLGLLSFACSRGAVPGGAADALSSSRAAPHKNPSTGAASATSPGTSPAWIENLNHWGSRGLCGSEIVPHLVQLPVQIDGIASEGEGEKKGTFQVRTRPGTIHGRHFYPAAEGRGEAYFTLYDDGWRLEKR
jgi:hypothetical protein